MAGTGRRSPKPAPEPGIGGSHELRMGMRWWDNNSAGGAVVLVGQQQWWDNNWWTTTVNPNDASLDWNFSLNLMKTLQNEAYCIKNRPKDKKHFLMGFDEHIVGTLVLKETFFIHIPKNSLVLSPTMSKACENIE